MPHNRSVPTSSILPHVVYRNVDDAVAWLAEKFGFEEHYRYGGSVGPSQGAQMPLGNAWIMVEVTRPGRATPTDAGAWTQMLTVLVDDVEAHYRRIKASGVSITEDLNETMYGERQYVAADLDGHLWLFSEHITDINPREWGARTTDLTLRFT